MAELISRLLTWITLTVVFPNGMLSISGLVWNVFISSVFRGRDKGLNGTSPIDRDLGIEAMQYAAIFTRNVPARLYIASLFYTLKIKLILSARMDMTVNLEQILRTVELLLHNQSPAHDFQHILRVYRNAEMISRKEEGADLDIVLAATYYTIW